MGGHKSASRINPQTVRRLPGTPLSGNAVVNVMVVDPSASARREYAARMNRVLDYIQNHLADRLDLEQLAAVARFSSFHFPRLFRAWMGETLQSFVHRLRLERAEQLLVFDQCRSISDIASECGFSSSGTFARAFRQAFGTPAGEWRRRKICETNRKGCEADEDTFLGFSKAADTRSRYEENPITKIPFHVRVQRLAPETIAYIRHIGPYKGDTTLFRRLFGQLFAWAEPRSLMGPEPRYLSRFQDNPNLTPAARQRLEVAWSSRPAQRQAAKWASERSRAAFMRQGVWASCSKAMLCNGMPWWGTGCREADTSQTTVRRWSFTWTILKQIRKAGMTWRSAFRSGHFKAVA
jgi:AraC family transcriptional regulator